MTITIIPTPDTSAWSGIGQILFNICIGIGIAYAAWKAKKAAAAVGKVDEIAVKVASTAVVVEEVRKSTDGAMTLQKKALAEVTAAKFAVTHDPVDKVTADAALKDYLDHVALKTKQNGGHTPTIP